MALAAVATMWLRDPSDVCASPASTEPIRVTISALTHTPSYGIILAEAGSDRAEHLDLHQLAASLFSRSVSVYACSRRFFGHLLRLRRELPPVS